MSETQRLPAGGGRSILLVAFCCLAAMGEGVDLQAPGVTLPVLAPLFGLSANEGGGFLAGFLSTKSLFLSMSTFGLMLGAMIGGRLSDLIGRKWVTVASVAVFGLMSILTAHSTSASMLLWLRFLTGVGLGGAMPNLIAIVAENVSLERRSTAVGFLYASLPTGGATVSLAAFAFANPTHWPWIYYLGGIVPLLAIPGLVFGLPNRPPVHDTRAAAAPRAGIAEALFGGRRAAVTLALWLGFFFALIAMYILLGWLPSLLVGKGLSRPDASIVQVGFNVFGAVGSVLTGLLIDRPRRGLSVALVFVSAIVSLAILAGAPPTLAIAFLVVSLVGCTVSGTQTILYALAPSCYPTEVRGTGVGFAVAVGRFGSAMGPLLAGAMLGGGASATRVLAALVPVMIIAGAAALFCALGTRARKLDLAVAH